MADIEKIKKLRSLSGAGFKDCSSALDESNGNIDKAIEILRVKGISKASKKMSRSANEGLIAISEDNQMSSILEINCETDFVAKNEDFINFCKEISEICFQQKGNLEKINSQNMKNNTSVKDNLIDLIAKIGEKITLRRAKFFDNTRGKNFSYVHGAIEKNIGKIISVVKLANKGSEDIGTKLAMHIAASNPLSVDKEGLDKAVIEKELEIIKAELLNSGKKPEMIEKISKGKLQKFISDNTLLNQIWIMDPKMKVSDVLKDIKVIEFTRYKVGEGA